MKRLLAISAVLLLAGCATYTGGGHYHGYDRYYDYYSGEPYYDDYGYDPYGYDSGGWDGYGSFGLGYGYGVTPFWRLDRYRCGYWPYYHCPGYWRPSSGWSFSIGYWDPYYWGGYGWYGHTWYKRPPRYYWDPDWHRDRDRHRHRDRYGDRDRDRHRDRDRDRDRDHTGRPDPGPRPPERTVERPTTSPPLRDVAEPGPEWRGPRQQPPADQTASEPGPRSGRGLGNAGVPATRVRPPAVDEPERRSDSPGNWRAQVPVRPAPASGGTPQMRYPSMPSRSPVPDRVQGPRVRGDGVVPRGHTVPVSRPPERSTPPASQPPTRRLPERPMRPVNPAPAERPAPAPRRSMTPVTAPRPSSPPASRPAPVRPRASTPARSAPPPSRPSSAPVRRASTPAPASRPSPPPARSEVRPASQFRSKDKED